MQRTDNSTLIWVCDVTVPWKSEPLTGLHMFTQLAPNKVTGLSYRMILSSRSLQTSKHLLSNTHFCPFIFFHDISPRDVFEDSEITSRAISKFCGLDVKITHMKLYFLSSGSTKQLQDIQEHEKEVNDPQGSEVSGEFTAYTEVHYLIRQRRGDKMQLCACASSCWEGLFHPTK